MKQALTPQQIAALAAGAKLGAPAQTGTTSEETKPTQGAATEGQAASEEAPAAATTETAAQTAAQAAAQAAPDQTAVIDLLKSQLAAAQGEVVELKVSLKASTDKASALEAAQAGLVEIAANSLNNMRIALGMSSINCSAVSVDVLLKDHGAVSAQFTETFKAGGVSAASATESFKPATPDAVAKARVAATRI